LVNPAIIIDSSLSVKLRADTSPNLKALMNYRIFKELMSIIIKSEFELPKANIGILFAKLLALMSQ
jgi:hypothetical protein